MYNSKKRRPRTAVLVVHGMGSQRALDTVRGIINAVWRLDDDPVSAASSRRVWTHPEKSGVDIDLSVMTTNDLTVQNPTVQKPDATQDRCIDFHELYWAHLMSETRAVAVLLWLFELVRKGPRLKPGMNALWWGASIFLAMLLASAVLLLLHATLQFLGQPPLVSTDSQIKFGTVTDGLINIFNHGYHEPEAILIQPFFVLCVIATFATLSSVILRAFSVAAPAAAIMAVTYAVYVLTKASDIRHFTELFLPIILSVGVAYVIMGRWGAGTMIISLLSGWVFFGLSLYARDMIRTSTCWLHLPGFLAPDTSLSKDVCLLYFLNSENLASMWDKSWMFWSLNERFSAVIAVWIILTYLALYALFLQPYLGDAARYFRNSPGNVAVRRQIRKEAVDTLAALHTSGRYDRIIVVAHSLGTVVAYDMLRAYFSRICNELPTPNPQDDDIEYINNFDLLSTGDEASRQAEFRRRSRNIVRAIAEYPRPETNNGSPPIATWLVTDFVTLGSPLTHAEYLMCNGTTHDELTADFSRRVDEREFPTCPPKSLTPDGRLLFKNQATQTPEYHHGAVFGLTRWTNLYFPLHQLFWGDAIGGPLGPLFGGHIRDIEACTNPYQRSDFFTHTAYWSVGWPNRRHANHIEALKAAINLEDKQI